MNAFPVLYMTDKQGNRLSFCPLADIIIHENENALATALAFCQFNLILVFLYEEFGLS